MCDYLSCIPIRLCPLVLLNELPLHDLEPTHFLLYIFHLIIQHKALLVQILQSCLPALAPEVHLGVEAGLDVVAPDAAQVFGDHHADQAGINVRNELLPSRAFE